MPEQCQLWINARLYTPQGVIDNGRLLVSPDGRIGAVGGAEARPDDSGLIVRDLGGLSVLPGFVDIHIHGGGGGNVMDASYDSLDKISRFHARHGTTSLLATTTTGKIAAMERALDCAAEAMKRGTAGAEIAGIHLEGPFLNLQRIGAQNKEEIRLPEPGLIERFWEASQGRLRLVTLAPELDGGFAAVRRFAGKGVTVSIGHSDAVFDEVAEAVRCGASQTTHHFNGMSPLHHREPGVAGAGLVMPELTVELIADGGHVHPAVIRLLFAGKTPRKVCLITDAVACAGLPDGDYGELTMTGGQVYLKDGCSLAGSSLTMHRALLNVMRFTGLKLEEALPSLTETPARQAGLDDRKGSLAVGKDADFLIVDDELRIVATYVGGREVYRSGEPTGGSRL